MIKNYCDFLKAMDTAGFSMGGGNAEGIHAVVPWNWNEAAPYETPVSWHTGDPEMDPWEWRMRILDEQRGIAYAKLFFNKSGYITKEWYPYFLAVRRSNLDFMQDYQEGRISLEAKRIYQVIEEYGTLPIHAIKSVVGVAKEDKARFDRAMVELQMKMYLTMCGRQQKISQKGEEYGWSATVFCRTEDFFEPMVFEKAAEISAQMAIDTISARIYQLNPLAKEKKIIKFIRG